jgi:hypothetical protein
LKFLECGSVATAFLRRWRGHVGRCCYNLR